ncbi:MAG: hypothetical protein LBT62_00525 [Deltaproteobacteria bacterium]|nr:hypothetical protein [Deltaproteobacteria bacterium]
MTAQSTFSRRDSGGPGCGKAQRGALINIEEPERETVLIDAPAKQLTGGAAFTGRFLSQNLFEFRFEGKPFISVNQLPRESDDAIFSSGGAKIILFDRHFTKAEQDESFKQDFRRANNKSAILNRLIAAIG